MSRLLSGSSSSKKLAKNSGAKRASKPPVDAEAIAAAEAERAEQLMALQHLGFSIDGHLKLMLLALLSLLLQSLIFEPISFWPLSFVCLVPWVLMVGTSSRAPRVYFYSYCMGLAFFLINMRWLYFATGVGYVALSAYLAVYFPLMACPLRHAMRRRRLPLVIVLPVIWVGSEMLRAWVVSGFPWFYLSHSVHGVLSLIQISDLVGAYGVSFVIAAINGALADCAICRVAAMRDGPSATAKRYALFGKIVAGVLLVSTLVYGQVQIHRGTSSLGPKIAVIQGDFVSSVVPEETEAHEDEKKAIYFDMMRTVSKEDPDLVLLPESPWWMFLNAEARGEFWLSRESFIDFRYYSDSEDACVVTGCGAKIKTPMDPYADMRRYNSAMVFLPRVPEPERYDKRHLVYFGEIVPFRFGRLRFLYFWINSLMPFSGPDNEEFSYFQGESFRQFSMKASSQGGKDYRFAIPICYEDVMPYIAREFSSAGAETKQVDFLLNISNDGWFGRGIQQPQHLAICVFRAVENRVGIARAVNTGISAFINPNGRIEKTVDGDPENPWPRKCGYAVSNIVVDSRYTYYSQMGDWFAWTCAALWLILCLDYMFVRATTKTDDSGEVDSA